MRLIEMKTRELHANNHNIIAAHAIKDRIRPYLLRVRLNIRDARIERMIKLHHIMMSIKILDRVGPELSCENENIGTVTAL